MTNDLLIAEKVAEIYQWLDSEIEKSKALLGDCSACGQCCDFENFDHLLFVTSPELVFLKQKIKDEKIKTMKAGRCPYNKGGKCTIYPFRFAGCRIFFCKGNRDFQNEISELTNHKFKKLCEQHNLPYSYCDLKTALNTTLCC
jgi:Fe-S-cluster containining protein